MTDSADCGWPRKKAGRIICPFRIDPMASAPRSRYAFGDTAFCSDCLLERGGLETAAVHRRWNAPTEPFRRRHQVAVLQDPADFIPINFVVEAHADPSLRTHIGRDEKAFGVGVDEDLLDHRRGLHPYRDVTTLMMIVVGHRQHAAASHTKSAFAPRLFLESFGECEA